MTPRVKLQWVEPSELRPNRWNPNVMDPDMLAKARASIHKFGFVDPVTVRDTEAGLEIVDGEHRWQIAVDDEMGAIPVMNLGVVTDSIARQLTVVLNETRGQPDPTRLGDLLKTLMATETKDHLLSLLPYTREALDRLTGLPSLTWEALDRPQRPQLPTERPSAWVERIYRMPKESAEVIDEAISKLREDADGASDWQALELICADYLGG